MDGQGQYKVVDIFKKLLYKKYKKQLPFSSGIQKVRMHANYP